MLHSFDLQQINTLRVAGLPNVGPCQMGSYVEPSCNDTMASTSLFVAGQITKCSHVTSNFQERLGCSSFILLKI